MGYKYLNNIELEKALDTYIKKIKLICSESGIENIKVTSSLGRIASSAVYAKISLPHYNSSAMDGIALKAKSTYGASITTPVKLIENKDFIWINTGDKLPKDCDAVIMIEDIIKDGNDEIKIINAASPWQHIRQIGEDICANEMIIPSNTIIEPASIGAMIASGVLNVDIIKKPIIGIIPTGDEIVNITNKPKDGEIVEFNSSIFSSMITKWGAITKIYDIAHDEKSKIKESIKKALKECDIVLVNAGSSAGKEDYTKSAIEEIGEVLIHGIAIKPGKPTILAIVDNKPVIGIPGYPVSGIIVMKEIVKKVVEFYLRIKLENEDTIKAVLTKKIVSTLKYKEFIRMRIGKVGKKIIATPLARGAGIISSFIKADGILEVPMNIEGLEKGSFVNINLLNSINKINNSIIIVGSHDPLIDTISDLIRRNYNKEYIISANVGSIGGIMAIKNNEAHLSGIHLLDEKTGEYNISYINKYFKKGEICIIKGVKRKQGIIIRRDDKSKIKNLNDLRSNIKDKENIRYVNRQKGSGTRILFDYLLKKNNISYKDIDGYDKEEFNHMSIATLIFSKSADAGMGIYAACKAYNLYFIDVCEEEYDFIIRKEYLSLIGIKSFIEVLKSNEFKKMLDIMGGYDTKNAGEIIVV